MEYTSLEARIEKIEAIHEIEKVMSKYEYLVSSGLGKEIMDLFARKTHGVSANIGDWGVYEGIENVSNLFIGVISAMMQSKGCMGEADLTNAVIEVAGDGKTAKAVWTAPGHETTRDPLTGKLRPGWCWTKYACDFVKEDGQWKIWHFNNFLTFFAEYEKGWVEGGEHYTRRSGEIRQLPVEFSPNGPPTHRHNPYHPDTKREFLPAFPQPYETYDGSQDWIDPNKPVKQTEQSAST